MSKAIIFDFDGVVIDSESLWPGMQVKIIQRFIPTWTMRDQMRLAGQDWHGSYALLTSEYGYKETFKHYESFMEDAHRQDIIDIYATHAALTPGVEELLKRLVARGIPLSIASSSDRHSIQTALKRLHAHPYFTQISSKDDVPKGRTKPNPDIYLLAAKRAGRRPSECIAIEDSVPGLTAAKAAGLYCIAYRTDYNRLQDMSAADMHIDHFDELTDAKLNALLA